MILEITSEEAERLTDADLRELVGKLCEREVRAHGHSTSAVTWGGHQNAADGGIDVRVSLPLAAAISGYVPRTSVGFQVKAQDMPRSAIQNEMAPAGVVLPSIEELADKAGAYIIVSSKGSVADAPLADRKSAMHDAVAQLPSASMLTLDFYDRRRVASWVNQHPGIVPWVRERLGLPLSGWRPFEDWSSSPAPIDSPYVLDGHARLVGPSIKDADGLNAEQAIARLRQILVQPKGIVRLVGLSGVGKTRLIQALFDDRIGTNALLRSDALYTDISDDPSPVPQELLARLIHDRDRIVLIVDNCGTSLHAKIATKVSSSDCLLSVITVEYDINDDELQDTDVFRLEPASPDLIEKILETRYPNIAAPSCRVIARFSEGNARVAFAIAETAKNGESLANIRDTELFERLFYQQKTHSPELLDAAKVCALLYSFDGETLDGQNSEIVPLAKLSGHTVDQLHKHIADLQRRQLVQQRSKWRAILPHALANRLAKRALEDIPPKRIEETIIDGPSERMLRSFSRRIGYLHDDPRATAIASAWLSIGGKLRELGRLNSLGEELFENIAPVNPSTTLAFIEKISTTNPDLMFGNENSNRSQIVKVVRAIAYDPNCFSRCAYLLRRFLESGKERDRESALNSLKSLFWLYLSGTHASISQRTEFVSALLKGETESERELGLVLLGELLRASHFSPSHSFEFGAWKRDYGLHPNSGDDVRDWYTTVIGMTRSVEKSGTIAPDRVRHVMATHFRELLQVGMFDEVVSLATAFAENGGWPEGWVGVRGSLRRLKDKQSDSRFAPLQRLEDLLRPRTLAAKIRAYALTAEYGALDIVDPEDELNELKPFEAREKVHEMCVEFGKQLVVDAGLFNEMLPELLEASSQKTFALGRGIAAACGSLPECWDQIRKVFIALPPDRRRAQLPAGFLYATAVRSSDSADAVLDRILETPELHPYFMGWQVATKVDTKAFERMMTALTMSTVPVGSFVQLSGGRAHEGLNDEQFDSLIRTLLSKDGGSVIAAQIVGMRFFVKRADKQEISEELRATGRYFLSRVEMQKGERLDHSIGHVIEDAYSRPEHELEARELAARILDARNMGNIYGWDVGDIITSLTKTFPIVVLDMFVEQAVGEEGTGSAFFQDIRSNRACPLDVMPDGTWMAWASHKVETRYELLARVMRFSTTEDEEHAKGWSPAALKLIEIAPDPVKVLDIFLRRFRPSGWSGSLADTLATRMPLIDRFRDHPNPHIATWASKGAAALAEQIERERVYEARETRARDNTFE
jgi:hypothetical protein